MSGGSGGGGGLLGLVCWGSQSKGKIITNNPPKPARVTEGFFKKKEKEMDRTECERQSVEANWKGEEGKTWLESEVWGRD